MRAKGGRRILLLAMIGSISLIMACKKKDNTENLTKLAIVPPAEFNANVNGTAITFTTYSYSNDTSRSNINAESSNGILNFFMDSPLTVRSYTIDNFSNRAWFNTASALVTGKKGTLNISKIENNLISGDFSFSTASGSITGSFVSISKK